MYFQFLALALVGVVQSGLLDTKPTTQAPLAISCANVRCSTGACEDTPSGPKCVKPGSCPPVKEGTGGICLEACTGDSSCTGDQKCCSNGCGHVCVDPVSHITTTVRPVITCANIRCSTGACEDTPSGPRCVKPGSCPVVKEGTVGICLEECTGDSSCTGDQKCCSNGCGRVCVDPVSTTTSTVRPVITCANVRCSTGACEDTPSGPKCVKPGSCPLVKEGTIGICLEGCTGDSSCTGDKKCCSNGCGRVCVDPVSAITTTVRPVTTCAVIKCAIGFVCVDYPTGGKCEPTTRAGTCPLVLCAAPVNGTSTTCMDDCQMDSDCRDLTHKCCSQCGCTRCVKSFSSFLTCASVLCIVGTSCIETPSGPQCVNNTFKDGECPLMKCPLIASLVPVTCPSDSCDSDWDCKGTKKCCRDCNKCGYCHEPPKPPSCDDIKCKPGHECVLQEVQCVTTPCYPIPTCVIHKCLQPKQPGLCKAYFPSWYFDSNKRRCKEFIYGGCGGNDNRFSSEEECKKACGDIKCPKEPENTTCTAKNECSRRPGRRLPVCPQGQSCCRTPCGRKCRVPTIG